MKDNLGAQFQLFDPGPSQAPRADHGPFDVDPRTLSLDELNTAYEHADDATHDKALGRWLSRSEGKGTQLSMFRPAGQLAALPSTEKRPGRSQEDFVASKLRESRVETVDTSGYSIRHAREGENSTYESVRQYGVQTPVLLEGGQLRHGHHRVYSANDINPAMEVPVTHVDKNNPRPGMGNPLDSFHSGWVDPSLKKENDRR
jgi:hypothetical protein